jgi:hypothetical protein
MRTFWIAAFVLSFGYLAGCSGHGEGGDGHHGLKDKIRAATATPDSAALTPGADVRKFYEQLETVAFQEAPGGDTFHVLDRRPSIKRFPCSECHAVQGTPKGDRRAHFGIVLDHAPTASMNCATCHGDVVTGHGSAMGVDSLASLAGSRFPFEVSHRLCAQCHFEQARDFLGGAHGKRVHGWQGKRVMQGCVSCHDPHAPALPKRWPSTMHTPDQEDG